MREPANGLSLFRFACFPDERHGIVHAISTRQGGVSPAPYDSLNLSLSVPDEPERVYENRRRFARALKMDPERMVSSRQVHGDDVLLVEHDFQANAPLVRADIQATDRPGWLLTLRFADCVPILLADPDRSVVAVVHAGWRGTLKQAVGTAVATLGRRYGVPPAAIRAGIGPSIGPCCYEVGPEVAAEFADWPAGVVPRSGARPHLDLWALNRATLELAGVPANQIELAGICTRCRSDLFFSHRAHGYPAGRFSAAIGLR
jgi:YfiH family protein